MVDDSNRDELIERYLQGGLSGGLLEEFKQKLATDEQFKREVAYQGAIIKGIKAVGRKEWASRLEQIHLAMDWQAQNDRNTQPVPVVPGAVRSIYKRKYFLIAAASVIFIIAVLFLLKINDKSDPERLFLSYYKPYPAIEQISRSLSPDVPSERKKAFSAYNNEDYLESIRGFKAILARKDDEDVLFYLGNSYLSANDPANAEIAFKKYLENYKEFNVESRWYLALSYLRQDKPAAAKILLVQLAKENNDYSERSAKILREW